jgi:hypothetical protein
MPVRSRTWEMDWAGPHGTAWGTVNACLTTITAAVIVHEVERHWPLSVLTTMAATVGAVVVGVIYTLLRAALGKPQQGATVAYKLLCWVGIGVWLVTTLHDLAWTWRSFVAHIVMLVIAAVVAGLAAGLASDPKPAPPVEAVAVAAPAVAPASTDPELAQRDKLAVDWEQVVNEFCDGGGYTVPNVELWPRGNGYSVQIVVPGTGGRDFSSVTRHIDDFAAHLDLVFGGAIKGSMGLTRRVAILDVTTVDILAEETEYPDDRPVHSIRDDLQIGHRDDGSLVGPNLLQYCMNLSGEARSGKTNASHCLTAEIVTTDDCLQWDWELTGGGLWAAWMYDWLRGEYETPPIDWCAFDGRELLWMTRAALRIGHARKPGYRERMIAADDDKLPVDHTVPALIIVGDEIAVVTGNMSEHDEAKTNLTLIAFELGAVAVRDVFLGLRGTDDIISSGVQSQCHVRGVMKVNTKAEAGWTLGSGHDFGPEDTPYPGSGGLLLASGGQVIRMKWFRMKPSKIRTIARLASTRRPKLDEFSRLAANGRNADGTPMDDLYPGELDCYDTRWERFRVHSASAGSAPQQVRVSQPAMAASGPQTAAALTPEQAKAGIDAAMAAVDQRIAELNADSSDEDIDDEFQRLMAAEGFGDDWVADESCEETAPTPEDEPTMLRLIREAGPQGIRPQDLLGEMGQAGIFKSRSTLHNYLNAAKARGQVHQPRTGRWAIGPKP